MTFRRLFLDHLGADGDSATLVQESWPAYDHVNVQTGLDAWRPSPVGPTAWWGS